MRSFFVFTFGVLFVATPSFAYRVELDYAAKVKKQIEIVPSALNRLHALTAESILLPITEDLGQGATGTCWIYGTLNTLETNYLVQHPNKTLELNRAAVQYWNWEDRYLRKLIGAENNPFEGGTPVDAIELSRRYGMIALADWNHAPKEIPWRDPFSPKGATLAEQVTDLMGILNQTFGEPPKETHFEGNIVSREQLAHDLLDGAEWASYAPALNGPEGVRQHPDPDARKGTTAIYVSNDKFLSLIYPALARHVAMAVSVCGHDMEVYGADFDGNHKAILLYIKDSASATHFTADPTKMELGKNFCSFSTLKL